MHVSATWLAPDWPVCKATPSDNTERTARSIAVVEATFLSRPRHAQCTSTCAALTTRTANVGIFNCDVTRSNAPYVNPEGILQTAVHLHKPSSKTIVIDGSTIWPWQSEDDCSAASVLAPRNVDSEKQRIRARSVHSRRTLYEVIIEGSSCQGSEHNGSAEPRYQELSEVLARYVNVRLRAFFAPDNV